MSAQKEGTPQLGRPRVPIYTVGTIIHAHHYRDAVVAAFLGLTLSVYGCGGAASGGHPPSGASEAPFEVHSVLRVETTPIGAGVWVGSGCADTVPQRGDSVAMTGRFLGRVPLAAPLTAADLSPGGDLEYSIRYGASLWRNGRIRAAASVLRQGGSFRITGDLETSLTDERTESK